MRSRYSVLRLQLLTFFVSKPFNRNCVELLVNILLLAIYLMVKPENGLITQFFVVIVVCQFFNFDMFNSQLCGILGIICTIIQNLIPLCHIPNVIETRCTSQMNVYIISLSAMNYIIWALWSYLTKNYCYMIGQFLAQKLVMIELMFYLWANRIIIKSPSEKSTMF